MLIQVRYSGKRQDPGDEYEAWCDVLMDGKTIARGSNFSDCPEDANLGRDLGFVYGLHKALRKAYEAGRDAHTFVVDHEENQKF